MRGCAARIDKALDAAGIRHSVDLENKTVTVDGARGPRRKFWSDLALRRRNE